MREHDGSDLAVFVFVPFVPRYVDVIVLLAICLLLIIRARKERVDGTTGSSSGAGEGKEDSWK